MTLCPCGCGLPVKPGRTYAGSGCSKRKFPIRLCVCGCGRRVRVTSDHPDRRWATPQCVPRELRQQSARKARRVYMLKHRRERFGDLLNRVLEANGGKITRGELYAAFVDVADRAYRSGYRACEWKHERARRTAA